MARTLHVLTAVTRPENLSRIAGALAFAAGRTTFSIAWHWKYDLERENVGGQAIKNAMLDEIPMRAEHWVWILDDDTLPIAAVLMRLEEELEADPLLEAMVVAQMRNDPRRVLPVGVDFSHPGHIDIGQAFLRRELIGAARIPLSYEGDGIFLEELLDPARGARVRYVSDVLSVHNALDV